MDVGTLLRATRIRHGLTQADVARRAGTSQPVISAYEHGRRDPTTVTLERLLAAAGGRLELRVVAPLADLTPPTSLEEHAARLIDVLLLADAIPALPIRPLTAPRLVSV